MWRVLVTELLHSAAASTTYLFYSGEACWQNAVGFGLAINGSRFNSRTGRPGPSTVNAGVLVIVSPPQLVHTHIIVADGPVNVE